MINKDNYVTAQFIDEGRKNIEVLLKSEDETAVNPYILEYDVDNPICQELLKLCSLDQLHENTYTKKQEERKVFVNQVKKIAQKEAILLDPVYSGKAFAGLIDLIRKKHFRNSDKILFIHTGGSVS